MLILSDKREEPAPGLRWARSATKHRISRERSRFVIEHCGRRVEMDPVGGPVDAATRLVFLGDDAGGVPLEVMAIELEDDSPLVIHAMKLRGRYRDRYEEAKQWRR